MLPNTANGPNNLPTETTPLTTTLNTSFTPYFNKQAGLPQSTASFNQLMKATTTTQLESSINNNSAQNYATYTTSNGSSLLQQQHVEFQKSLYKNSSGENSIPESSESNSNDVESRDLNDSSSSISTVDNNEAQNSQSLIQKKQAEIAMQLQQEMNKKNLEAQLIKKNPELSYQQRILQQQQQQSLLMYQQTLLQPNIFNLPLQQTPHMMNPTYQNKINSFQSDEAARQLKRSLIHFKPY